MQNSGSNGSATSDHAAGLLGANGHPKRTRVLLSCLLCRNSKLKCDRATPCGQCLRRGKPDGCVYAPRPEKLKPAKSMAARLKRLEGMVREMIDTDGPVPVPPVDTKTAPEPNTGGLVVQGQKATSYVGGTHFLAMLEDIEDLKSYFEDSNEIGDEIHDPFVNTGSAELLMFSRGVPKNKEELLSLLPEKAVVARLMNRYFNSNSPSQHIVHVPTFLREYNDFCKDPAGAHLHWIALLYMVLSLGVFFSLFSAPHELENDSSIPGPDRFKQYRGAAGWALIWGKYSQPCSYTLQAFTLYVEGDFMNNRESRMNCYLLSSVLIRLMLKMGLHRDPSKLPNISPYDGEMRRRMWNLATQLDLLVSFNLGLPSMMHGIETDTGLPTHLKDTDFDKDTKVLPPARPTTDYTSLTYPINKSKLTQIFALVVRQAHALALPTYDEVMKVERELRNTWQAVPTFMTPKPMDQCVMDPPIQITQRFGLATMYCKVRIVLHRRYVSEVVPQKEHDYSRQACVDAALSLLGYQNTMHEACRPNGVLSQGSWFVAALISINDFLLADMVVALVIQNDKYWDEDRDFDWLPNGMAPLSRNDLLQLLKRSHSIWSDLAGSAPELRKAEVVVRTMLRRIQAQFVTECQESETSGIRTNSSSEMTSIENLTIDDSGPSTASSANERMVDNLADFSKADLDSMMMMGDTTGQIGSDPPWIMQDGYDWVCLPTYRATLMP
ncbi:hypothetical protein GGR54DRAFT_630097 [Hypoxylon sp. NC1633]|nr:hypothetical protein GGR54DRAFT_630097 [Hypoxylon sp. NC1633]